MLHAKLRKAFRARPEAAAFALDIEIKQSAGVSVLFGPSGSGKTLALDLIAGFVKPDEGRVLLEDDILFDGASGVNLPPRARHCGYVFQNYALFPHMTLRKNLEFAAERRPRLERHRRVNELLEQFRLTEVAGRRPHEVSGGQRQRCSIARALIGAPKLLLLDEPAQGLDAPLRGELYQVLRQVRRDFGTPILLVTHDLAECLELGDEMLVMREGKIVQRGTPDEVIDKPANLEVARLLGLFNLLPAEVRLLDPGRNQSLLRVGQFDIEAAYLPGRLKGDRVTLCVRPEQVVPMARDGKPGPNQMPAHLERVVQRPQGVRLEFSGGIAADVSRNDFERLRGATEWLLELPKHALRVL